jgi:hypothetical protein
MPTTIGSESKIVIVDADAAGPGNFSFEHYTKPTIVRIVGNLTIQLNQSGSVVENYKYRYLLGLMCADEDKAAGRLDEELGHSWLWMASGTVIRPKFNVNIPVGNAGGTQNVQTNDFGSPLMVHSVNVKSMRKVARDCELRLVLHCQDISVAPANVAPHITGFLRCLIKE